MEILAEGHNRLFLRGAAPSRPDNLNACHLGIRASALTLPSGVCRLLLRSAVSSSARLFSPSRRSLLPILDCRDSYSRGRDHFSQGGGLRTVGHRLWIFWRCSRMKRRHPIEDNTVALSFYDMTPISGCPVTSEDPNGRPP